MNWYTITALALGHLLFFSMVVMLPGVVLDFLLQRRLLVHFRYPGNATWLLLRRFVLPSLLMSPGTLWQDGLAAIRRQHPDEAREMAIHLAVTYGKRVAPEPQEETPHLRLVHSQPREPHPYFGSFYPDKKDTQDDTE